MNKFKKFYNDFEKVRQIHLSIQDDFLNKIQSMQFRELGEYQK
jgi:hypothetical protein